jgi:hypothetical protein
VFSGRNEQERFELRGMGGIYTSSHRKLTIGVKGTRILRVYVRILRTLGSRDSSLRETMDGEQLPENSGCLFGYSGTLCPDIPNYETDNPGITGNFTRRLFIVVGLILMVFVDSLKHNYHVNTCGSKSFLIVLRSYTQFQNKI